MAAMHGKFWIYADGCRCVECRAAWTAYNKQYRATLDPSTVPPEAHGNPSTYKNWRCRCNACTAANAAATAAYRARKRT